MTGSWFDGLGAAVAEYAATVYAAGEEAGAAVSAQLGAALARLQGLPDEAAAAVAELTTALAALFPDDPGHAPPSAPPAECDAGAGQAGGFAGAIGAPAGTTLPRRWTVDAAGLARFLRQQHPAKTAEHAAARTRLPVDTIAKILTRESLGNGRTLLAFVAAYGPEVLAATLPGASERWLEGARILADQVRLDAELARTRDEAARNSGRWTLCGLGFGGAP